MKLYNLLIIGCLLTGTTACSSDDPETGSSEGGGNGTNSELTEPATVAERNATRAIAIIDKAVENYFEGQSMTMSRYYNPYTGKRSQETGSVWMYTSAIEAVNAALHAMQALKDDGMPGLYNANWTRYTTLLSNLTDNLEYYAGTYTLTSYTGTSSWTVYAVNRASGKGAADVTGVLNVYDDQQWLIREFVEAYRATGEKKYLDKAEYLAAYVLDGWDCTLDNSGNENGGITWGPGYTTKHSCSNGPVVSPLVWLSDIYKGKSDQITYKRIDANRHRYEVTEPKADYYLTMAAKVYNWQKSKLYNKNEGVYWDMLGATGGIRYETVDGERYRANNPDDGPSGKFYSYNTGTMLSGAADLARATGEQRYRDDVVSLTSTSFSHFAKSASQSGCYNFDLTGFSPWFNGVLMRAYAEAWDVCHDADKGCQAFQCNLDYGYDNYLYEGMLPVNLLAGWSRDKAKCDTEAMFTFVSAAEYAVLARHEINKK